MRVTTAEPAAGLTLASLLEEAGLDRRLAEVVSAGAPFRPGDADQLRDAQRRLRQAVEASTVAPADNLIENPATRRIAFVGPTGVGKTTSIAKLAAIARLRHGRSVGLLTLDTYRIAAIDQLRVYADIIGIPCEVAGRPDQVEPSIRRLGPCDLIFVDTAGRSPRHREHLDQTGQMLALAEPDETCLVLTCSLRESAMSSWIERFGVVAPTGLIFSKLDETIRPGAALMTALRARLPIRYLTTGQEVPRDIEPATADNLARRIVESASAVAMEAGLLMPAVSGAM